MNVFGFSTLGTTSLCNIDTYVYSSIQGTVDSICIVLKKGRINDSYSLLRKYYDSVIINVYSNLFLQDQHSLENFIVDKINDWLHGRDRLPAYRVMSNYIRSSSKLSEINSILYSNKKYSEIRDRCNDHTHYNYFRNLMLNDGEVYVENRLQALDNLSRDIRDIFILHFGYLFFLMDHYTMSSDYIDHLEVGISPPTDSQFWVAPFIQEVFDNVVTRHREDIASAIKKKTDMQLH